MALELESVELASPNKTVQPTFDYLQHFISSADIVDAWLTQNPGKEDDDFKNERTLPNILINLEDKIVSMFGKNATPILWANFLKDRYSLNQPSAISAPALHYSRLFEGVSVMASYQKGQTKRVRVNELEIATAQAIFMEVASVRTGYKDIVSSILGGPFFISLVKASFSVGKDGELGGRGAKGSARKSPPKTPADRVNDFVRQRTGGASIPGQQSAGRTEGDDEEMPEPKRSSFNGTGGGRGEPETKSLFDLPDQILMDEMTQQVMQNYWIGFLEKVCEGSLTVGIVAFCYKEIVVSIPIYTEEEGDAESESDSEDDYGVEDYNGAASSGVSNGELLNAITSTGSNSFGTTVNNRDKSIRSNEREPIPGYDTYRPEYNFTGTGGARETLLKRYGVNTEKYDTSGEGLASFSFDKSTPKTFIQGLAEFLNTTVNNFASDPVSIMFKSDLTLTNAGRDVNISLITRNGGLDRDPLPMLKDSLNQQVGSSISAPTSTVGGVIVGGLREEMRALMDDFAIRMEAERETLEDRMKLLSEKERVQMGINSLQEDMVEKRLRLYGELELLKEDVERFKEKWRAKLKDFSDRYGTEVQVAVPDIPVSNNLKGIKDPDDYPDYFSKIGGNNSSSLSGKRRRRSSEEEEDGEATSPSVTETEGEVRKGGGGRSNKRRKTIKEKKTRRITKKSINVPHYVPVVLDYGKGHLEMYSDGTYYRYCWVWNDTNKIEPFAQFVIHTNCDKDGHLKSLISSMIPTYNKLKKEEAKIEEKQRENDTPIFCIETPAIKDDIKDKRYADARSYEPTFGMDGAGGGIAPQQPIAAPTAGVGSLFLNSQDPYAPTGGLYSIGEGGGRHPAWDGCSLQPDMGGGGGGMGGGGSSMYSNSTSAAMAQRDVEVALVNRYMFESPVQALGFPENCYTGGDVNCTDYFRELKKQEIAEFQTQNVRGMRMAEMNAVLLGRPCTYAPGLGIVIKGLPGEKITQISNREAIDTTRVEKLKKRLNEEGGIVGGWPLVNFQDVESKGPLGGRQSEQAFTTKSEMRTQNTQHAGFFVPNVSKNSTEELRKMNKDSWVKHFTRTVIEVFKVAYGNLYKSSNPWYRQVIEKTFEFTNIESAPDFYSLFDVNVTFPLNAPVDMNVMLALYNFGAVKGRDMALLMTSMASRFTGSLPKGYLEALSLNLRNEDYTSGEEEIIKNLEVWKGFEKERVESLIEVERAKAEASRTKAKTGGASKSV